MTTIYDIDISSNDILRAVHNYTLVEAKDCRTTRLFSLNSSHQKNRSLHLLPGASSYLMLRSGLNSGC